MSGSFLFNKQPVPVNVAITGNTVTTVVDATLKAVMVPNFEVFLNCLKPAFSIHFHLIHASNQSPAF